MYRIDWLAIGIFSVADRNRVYCRFSLISAHHVLRKNLMNSLKSNFNIRERLMSQQLSSLQTLFIPLFYYPVIILLYGSGPCSKVPHFLHRHRGNHKTQQMEGNYIYLVKYCQWFEYLYRFTRDQEFLWIWVIK